MKLAAVLSLVALGVLSMPAPSAKACGGFFCNATIPLGQTSPIRIVQAGERVLFVRTDDGVTMIVEVRYDGDPTSFAWLLPIPRPEAGTTLEDMLGVSVAEVFETLQDATEPQFTVAQVSTGRNDCGGSGGGLGCGDVGEAATGASANEGLSGTDDPGRPGVTIADEARVGSYEAKLVEADDAGALYTWLGDNGYFQDEAARPLLAHYIEDGWVFVAVRLQNGADLGDIRPIVLHLGEEAPCVPLRLTSIAANPDMPILVWVMGEGRAAPKNFLHAVVNEQAVSYPGAAEYVEVVSRAVDTASGRAWVTEHAGPTSDPALQMVPPGVADRILQADDNFDLQAALLELGDGPTLRAILVEELVPIEGGEAEFRADPLPNMGTAGVGYVHDLDTLQRRLRDELVAPLAEVDTLRASTTTLTRFFTTIDPSEMTRDPIFVFNPDLPDVSRQHAVTVVTQVDGACTPRFRVTYPDGRVAMVPAGSVVAPITGAQALARVELIDDEGPARPFHPDQVAEIDRLLDGASPGIPTLPGDFELERPPRDPFAPPSGPIDDDGGCRVAWPSVGLLLPLLALVWRARRRPHGSM